MSSVVLTINPGSTSTKIAIFKQDSCLLSREISHDTAELNKLTDMSGQIEYRLNYLREFLHDAEEVISISSIDLIMARGGLIGPVISGIYAINDTMKNVLMSELYGSHASNLGALLADKLGQDLGKPSFIADPPSVDELSILARYSGLNTIKRVSLFHALNHKAAAREAAAILNRSYEELQMIVCHMGGGVSVGLHCMGSVIDVNNALEEGPMSPERTGTLPTISLLNAYLKSGLLPNQFMKLLNGRGGLMSYTGSANEKALEAQMQDNPQYKEAIDAMIYQISKEIGALAAAAYGRIDSIVLTGGLARSSYICDEIGKRTSFISELIVIPGERELQALAAAGIRLLAGHASPHQYQINNREEQS